MLTPGQERFAGVFSRETGLDPHVVGSWLLAEQSGSAATGYERRGYNNYLNIANTDSGPASGANSPMWRNPETAAKASADWIRGRGQIAHEYGTPAPGIRNILKAAGRGADAQIQAIAGSGWASSGYEHGNTLRTLYHELSGQQLKLISVAQRQAGAAQGIAPVIPEGATRAPVAAPENPIDAIAAIQTGMGPAPPGSEADTIAKNWGLIKSLYNPSSAIAQPQSGLSTHESHALPLPGTMHEGPTKLGGFIPGNAPLTMGRLDQGQDIATTPGGPVLAPAAGVVVSVLQNPGGFGENYPVIRITDRNSPFFGKEIYIGHTHSALKVGDTFQAGQVISRTGHGTAKEGNARTPGWAEIGFWGASGPISAEGGKIIAPFLR